MKLGRISATGTVVLLKFDLLQSLKKLYRISILLELLNDTLLQFYQVQFLKLKRNDNAKSTIKITLKCSAVAEGELGGGHLTPNNFSELIL